MYATLSCVCRPPVSGPVPEYKALLASQREHLWAKPRWARGVLVYDDDTAMRLRNKRVKPLHVSLMQVGATAPAGCMHGSRAGLLFFTRGTVADRVMAWGDHGYKLCCRFVNLGGARTATSGCMRCHHKRADLGVLVLPQAGA